MKLKKNRFKQVFEALLDGYDEASLRIMVKLGLGEELDHLIIGNSFRDVVHGLIRWCEQTGRVSELIEAAYEHNRINEQLEELAKTYDSSWLTKSLAPRELLKSGFFLLLPLSILILWIAFFFYKDQQLLNYRFAVAISIALIITYVMSVQTSLHIPPLLTRISIVAIVMVSIVWFFWYQLRPPRFNPSAFGIAVARLTEGSSSNSSTTSRDITAQMIDSLCSTLAHSHDVDPCTNDDNELIQLRPVRLIQNSQEALEHGSRLDADMVIWGRLVHSSEGMLTVHFKVLDTFDAAANPDFPFVLPVTTTEADFFADLHEINTESDSSEFKSLIAEQTKAISAFVEGLYAYLEQDFIQSTLQFQGSLLQIDGDVPLTASDCDVPLVSSNNGVPLTASDTGRALILYYLARSHHMLGHIETGQSLLWQASCLNPKEPAIPLALAYGYRSLGDMERSNENALQARDLLNEWILLHPDDLSARYDRGIFYEFVRDYESALLDYEHILKDDPDFYVAYVNTGNALNNLQRYQEAIDILTRGLELAKNTGANPSAIHFRLARSWVGLEQHGHARNEYALALESNPQLPFFYTEYARFLEDQQHFDDALAVFDRLAEIPQNESEAYREKANLLRRLGDNEQAIAYYKRAIHSEPSLALTHTFLAETLLDAGQIDAAKIAYDEAIQIEPADLYSHESYAQFLHSQGLMLEAATIYEKLLEINPMHEIGLQNLGYIYRTLGKCAEAQSVYLTIIQYDSLLPPEMVQDARTNLEKLSDCLPSSNSLEG